MGTARSPFDYQLTFPHFSLFAVSAAASVVVEVVDVIEAPFVVFEEQHDDFLVIEAFFAAVDSVLHSLLAEAFCESVHSSFDVIDAFLAVLVVEQQAVDFAEVFLASSHFAEASVATKANPATMAAAASIRNFMLPSFCW